MGHPLTDDDDHHPDDYGSFELRELHAWLRRWGDKTIRDVEALVLLLNRPGMTHGRARQLLDLAPEHYRVVNRLRREAIAAVTLARRRSDDD